MVSPLLCQFSAALTTLNSNVSNAARETKRFRRFAQKAKENMIDTISAGLHVVAKIAHGDICAMVDTVHVLMETPKAKNFTFSNEMKAAILGVFATALTITATAMSNKNMNKLALTQQCIKKYNEIVENGKISDETQFNQFLEFVDEELYYIKRGLILNGLIDEWLTGC